VDRTEGSETTYYDSVSGKPLFVAPRGRSFADFLQESNAHGWPSFRDEEVVWENVRCLADGETVSLDGTHVSEVKAVVCLPVSVSLCVCVCVCVQLCPYVSHLITVCMCVHVCVSSTVGPQPA
jgi:hypothetical protein